MSDAQHNLRILLRGQDGIVSRAQAIDCGLKPHQIRYLITTGALKPIMPMIYRSTAHPPTPRSDVYAGSLRFGKEAVLIDQSAAWWWGLPVDRPSPITFSTHSHPRAPAQGIEFRRVYVADADRVHHRGVVVQAKPLAAIRAAAALEKRRHGNGLTFLDRVIQLGAVTADDMIGAITRHKHCSGNRLGRFLLDITEDRAASHAERVAGRLLHQAGITGWSFNVTVKAGRRRAVVDICFEQLKIDIEVDGLAFHSDPERFVSDRRRDNDLRAAGWWVIHVTWHDLMSAPEMFIETVRRAIAAQSAIVDRR